MLRIRIYTTRWCGFCVRAKALLDSRGLAYDEVHLDDDLAFRQTVHEATGGWTVPVLTLLGVVGLQFWAGWLAGRARTLPPP